MESLFILIAVCGFIFFLFAFNEVVRLKKEVKKIKGIVDYLLKSDKSKDISNK